MPLLDDLQQLNYDMRAGNVPLDEGLSKLDPRNPDGVWTETIQKLEGAINSAEFQALDYNDQQEIVSSLDAMKGYRGNTIVNGKKQSSIISEVMEASGFNVESVAELRDVVTNPNAVAYLDFSEDGENPRIGFTSVDRFSPDSQVNNEFYTFQTTGFDSGLPVDVYVKMKKVNDPVNPSKYEFNWNYQTFEVDKLGASLDEATGLPQFESVRFGGLPYEGLAISNPLTYVESEEKMSSLRNKFRQSMGRQPNADDEKYLTSLTKRNLGEEDINGIFNELSRFKPSVDPSLAAPAPVAQSKSFGQRAGEFAGDVLNFRQTAVDAEKKKQASAPEAAAGVGEPKGSSLPPVFQTAIRAASAGRQQFRDFFRGLGGG